MWARNQLITAQASDQTQGDFDDALAAFGLEQESDPDSPDPEQCCYLWPCNVPAWEVWLSVQTQWRIGMGGREGLDYASVGYYMRQILRIRVGRRWADIWSGLQAMERSAMNAWAEMANEKNQG